MLRSFEQLSELFNSKSILIANKDFNDIIQDYSFVHIHEYFDFSLNQNIIQNIYESEIIMINQCVEKKSGFIYLVIGFKKTILMINQSLISVLKNLFSRNKNAVIYSMSNINEFFQDNQYRQVGNDAFFIEEIANFNKKINLGKCSNVTMRNLWNIIQPCIAGYLIKQSYLKIDRKPSLYLSFYNKTSLNSYFNENEFIELRKLGNGSFFYVGLFYHIKKEELFAIKKAYKNDPEIPKLLKREVENYSDLNFSFFPKFYGIIRGKNYPVIEFINGQTLLNISSFHLNFNDKIILILDLMYIVSYFHEKRFVYRDLKPNNIMIDKNKSVYLIDFDRMIKFSEITSNMVTTADFPSVFADPGLNSKNLSYKNDIYSLGQMIYFIINEKFPKSNIPSENEKLFHPAIQNIYNKCTCYNESDRPTISQLITLYVNIFYDILSSVEKINKNYHKYEKYVQIDTKFIHDLEFAAKCNDPNSQFLFGMLLKSGEYVEPDINKAIHYLTLSAKQNYPDALFNIGMIFFEKNDINSCVHYLTLAANVNHSKAQYNLGIFYEKGKYVKQNTNKAIHYFTLAANQNHSQAQFNLGIIYSYTDINKSIYYLTLSANNNYPQAQFCLGFIYVRDKYMIKDIKKAIHYFTLASNNNIPQAQYILGEIYFTGKYILKDINKAYTYFSLAAKHNIPEAYFNLGIIYIQGLYQSKDINKAIKCFTQAANHNIREAQFNLGLIYLQSNNIINHIRLAIHYLSLAADRNYPQAQYSLGVIYLEGKFIQKDISKAIHYLNLASKNNIPYAQYNLGVMYDRGDYFTKDIYRAFHYFSLAANQNLPQAQYNLGLIYLNSEFISKDINKAIHYLTLAANNNLPQAQFNLWVIYSSNKYVKKDINKAVNYLNLSAKSFSNAQFVFGFIYFIGKYVKRNINKAIYFFKLASSKNMDKSQSMLGIIYLFGILTQRDTEKGISYLKLASQNNNILAHYLLGFLFHQGEFVSRNITKSISYYKKASTFNNQYAKNNLGVIFKNVFDGEISKNVGLAISYFDEAVRLKNDKVSMYNLAHTYIYEDKTTDRIDSSIELLIQSIKQNFQPAYDLLCIALIKKHGFNLESIKNELYIKTNQSSGISEKILQIILFQRLNKKANYEIKYKYFKSKDFLYDYTFKIICSTNIFKNKFFEPVNQKMKNISSVFYDGFDLKI